MNPTFLIRNQVTAAAGRIASVLGGEGHCALLAWGGRPEIEILCREDLPMDICAALSSPGGESLLGWARKTGTAHRLRGRKLESLAPELHGALQAHDVDSLALVPLLGGTGVLGFVCVALPGGWSPRTGAWSERAEGWGWATRIPGALQLGAGNAALRVVLKVREKEPPGGIDAVLVLDQENRVLLAHGFLKEMPGWDTDAAFGRPVKQLPGGKTIAAIGLDGPERLLWKERRLPGAGASGIPVGIAAAARAEGSSGPGAGTVYLLQDLRQPRSQEGPVMGSFLLELGMRVSHIAHRLGDLATEERTQESEAPSEGSGPISGEAVLWAAGELEQADVLLKAALGVADTDGRRDPVDLGEILRELNREHMEECLEERIQILPIVSPDLPAISGDARRLKTALRVLLQTSRDALQSTGGTIFLRAWEDDGNVFCTVSDDGPGMAETEIEELMNLEPLFPGEQDPVSAESFGAVRAVVEELAGRLHVESEVNLWTRFTVMLPAGRRSQRPARSVPDSLPPAVEVRSSAPGSLQVLVVDDNHSIRAILRRFLEKRGHLVTEATDGTEALDIVRDQEFDRLMVDVHMPGITGPEFFEDLDQVSPAMKERTIFMTGGVQEDSLEDYILGTGRPALEKPFDLTEMVRTLEG